MKKDKNFKTKFKKIIGVCFGYVVGFLLLFSVLCVSFAPMMVGAVNVISDDVVVTENTDALQMYNNNFNGTRWTLNNPFILSGTATTSGYFHIEYQYEMIESYSYDCHSILFGYRYNFDTNYVERADYYICLFTISSSGTTVNYVNIETNRLALDDSFILTVYMLDSTISILEFSRVTDYLDLVYVPSNYNVPINFTINCDYPLEADPSQYYCYFLGDVQSTVIYPNSAVHLSDFVNNVFNLNINTLANPPYYREHNNAYGYQLMVRYTGSVPVLKVYEYGTDREVDSILINGELSDYNISPKYYYDLTFTYDSSATTKHGVITLLIDDVDLDDVNEYYYDLGQGDGGHYYLFNEYMPSLVTYTDDDYGQGIYFDFTDALGREYTQMYFVRNEYTYELYGEDAYAIAYRKKSNDLLVHVYNSVDGWMHPAYKLIHTYVDFNDGTWVSLEKDYILLNSTDDVDPSNIGFILGESNGYDKGFHSGASQSFGENVLGSTLSAPIRAINQFVLFSVGGVDVTLGGVFGVMLSVTLFILFLKMFAGG